jgi:hypothetical protein
MKNRMRELRSCGTVRGEGSNALAYSEVRRPECNNRGGVLTDRMATEETPHGIHRLG